MCINSSQQGERMTIICIKPPKPIRKVLKFICNK